MTKLQIKSEIIAAFGGIFHVMDVFERLGLGRLIDSSLGKRNSNWNAFRYSEVAEALFCNYLCGGDCLEDINMLAPQLSLRPGTRIPSSDTVGRVMKSLATENISYVCENSGNSYCFNTAEKLSMLLLKMIKALGLLKAGEEVTLDFDHQFIPAHKFDAKYSYKKDYGYFPRWASNCSARYEEFREFNGWGSTEIDYQECELASFGCMMNGSKYRLVVQRSPKKEDGKIVTDIFGTVYVYRAIITNDWETSEKDVVLLYNMRGESEKNFDIQNNDFGWAHLPFSFLNENTAFMLITAMLKNFFLYLTQTLCGSTKAIKRTSRLKKVILHFICVPAKWIKSGRRNILKLYTECTYYKEILSP